MTERETLHHCNVKKLDDILNLTCELTKILSVTACRNERLDEAHRMYLFILSYLENKRLEIQRFEQRKYPPLLVGFPGAAKQRIMLFGHFDVVAPEPDDRQCKPQIAGDYVWGR